MNKSVGSLVQESVAGVSDLLLKLALIGAGCLLALAVALANVVFLVPLAAILSGAAIVWRAIGVWGVSQTPPTHADQAALEESVRRLVDEVERLRAEQTRLQTTVQWQERLLARLADERSARTSG